MKKGAVPIPHIVALLLGIVVIALIGYWFFFQSGLWRQQSSLTVCQGKLQTYCNDWKSAGYGPIVRWFDDVNPDCVGNDVTLGLSGGSLASPGNEGTDLATCQALVGGAGTAAGGNPLPGM